MGFNYTGFKGIYKRGLITVEQTQSQRGEAPDMWAMFFPCGSHVDQPSDAKSRVAADV